jgi:hypothetical protein
VERAVLGALGWCWLLVAAAAVGAGPRLGLVDPVPHAWDESTAAATSAILTPLVDPQALLGAAVFGVAAVLIGTIARARHLAIGLLGALLWAAGLEAALRIVADGGLAGRPALIAAAAAGVVILEQWLRAPQPMGRPAPIPGMHLLQIRGHSARPDTAIPGR